MLTQWKRGRQMAAAAVVLATAHLGWAETGQVSTLQVANIPAEAKATVNKSAGGNALKIGGKTFENGLGVQAPARILLNLKGGSERFTATVGVDDDVQGQPGGTATFAVIADGVQVYP